MSRDEVQNQANSSHAHTSNSTPRVEVTHTSRRDMNNITKFESEVSATRESGNKLIMILRCRDDTEFIRKQLVNRHLDK